MPRVPTLPPTRVWFLLVLGLLVLTGSAWAEFCKSQGSPSLPKSQAPSFDAQVLLTAADIQEAEQRHLRWGRRECARLLFHKEYVLCYDLPRHVAKWALYRLEAADVVEADRLNAFRSDPRLPESQNTACDDSVKSGFDRSHLVPRSDMNRTKVALVNTFFLTNMSPQVPNVNQGTWERLERLGRLWARRFGAVHVISGTIFDADDDHAPDNPADMEVSKSGSEIGVPSQLLQDLHP